MATSPSLISPSVMVSAKAWSARYASALLDPIRCAIASMTSALFIAPPP
jgi:hypothetical protein